MNNPAITPKQFKKTKRKAVNVSSSQLIHKSFLNNDSIPLIIQANKLKLNLNSWAVNNKELINSHLQQEGAILFRDFQLEGINQFEQFMKSLFGNLLDYSYGSTPRSKLEGKIYTSTEYPPEQSIPLHNEMSYTSNWPNKIAFYCVKAANEGGSTPIADSRNIFQKIDPEIREKFQAKGVMYVRNYGNNLDLSWQQAFQTNNKLEVESYCHKNGLKFEWIGNNLRTRQVCQAVVQHPKTQEMVWFNQAHLFHVSSLNSSIRHSLLEVLKEDELPRNAYYGDGTPLEDSVLEEIRSIYQQETILFPWQSGDLLLLDNLLVSHGRMPFAGSRKVVVGMSELISSQ